MSIPPISLSTADVGDMTSGGGPFRGGSTGPMGTGAAIPAWAYLGAALVAVLFLTRKRR